MSTDAKLGSLSQLKIGDAASPEVFTLLGEVNSIGGFGQRNDLVEVTHFQSTAKEYIYGLGDGKEFQVTCNYLPADAGQVAAIAAQAAKTTKNFEYILPPGFGSLKFTFAALILEWDIPNTPNAAMTMTLTLKCSGAITGPV